MKPMNPVLKEKINESLSAVLPITGIVLLIGIFLVPLELNAVFTFMAGAVLLIFGMGFFQLGAEMAISPLGEGIGDRLPRKRKIWMIVVVGFLMGLVITLSEPDLLVLAEQVPSIPSITLIVTVAVGVGLFLALAILRVLFRVNLSALMVVCYGLMFGLSFLVPRDFLAVAFDSGGVTTGPMTVPFIMALGIGMASSRSDKNAASDSFGLVALCSVGPILAVMILGCFYNPSGAEYAVIEPVTVSTTREAAKLFAFSMPRYLKEVLIALLPVGGVFLAFQLISKRYHKRQIKRVVVGFIYTYCGLALFLCGVNVGFSPVGAFLGREIAALEYRWLLIPIGAIIGYFIVKAEPAIQVLNHQVDRVTNGAISAKTMNRCLSIGISVSVGLAMLRVLTGLSILYILIPGYVIAVVMSRFVPDIFVGIAFDSGGVASGPMATTFLLPLSIGACEATGGNVIASAFGVIALVALTPLIAVQIMGLQYKFKMRKAEKAALKAIAAASAAGVIRDLEED